jgi:hypothetical protein
VLLTRLAAAVSTATVAGVWVVGVLATTGERAAVVLGSPLAQSISLGCALVFGLLFVLRTSSTRLQGGYS